MKAVLFAPEQYWSASQAVRDQVVNGCGTAGWKGDLVPDNVLGICFTPACNIHDWMYTLGKDMADKEEADNVFLNNMLRIIDADESWFGRFKTIRNMRRDAARGYFEAVHLYGGPAFWTGKNPDANMATAAA
jgi:hypothetical protein